MIAARLLIAGVVLLANAAAQDTSAAPEPQPTPPPASVVFQNTIPSEQMAFLSDYAGRSTQEIRKDKRFRALMKLTIPRTTYHYGVDMELSAAVDLVLEGPSLPIAVREGRYVTVASYGGPYLDGRGFVWFDIQNGLALGGVYFHPVNGEPTPTLAIYSRQLRETSLGMSQLPGAFAVDLAQWILAAKPLYVSPRYFIPENGKKYVLVHDEDYCSHSEGSPAPPEASCMQLNFEAADSDVSAAYFITHARNAANAMGGKVGKDQTDWMWARIKACGGSLECRIRKSRERTRELLAQTRR
jgi:hypothetical protein